jgi:hypothetical protein
MEGEMIKKIKSGYQVVSGKGRNLGGPYKTIGDAKNASGKLSSSNIGRARERTDGKERKNDKLALRMTLF